MTCAVVKARTDNPGYLFSSQMHDDVIGIQQDGTDLHNSYILTLDFEDFMIDGKYFS